MELKSSNMFDNSEKGTCVDLEQCTKPIGVRVAPNLIKSSQRIVEDDCPMLYLKNSTSDIGVYLRLFEDLYNDSVYPNRKIKIESYDLSIPCLLAFLDYIGESPKGIKPSNIGILINIIVFGHICEALCTADFPVKSIIFNADMLEKLINDSFDYYGYDTNVYKFNFSNLEPLIEIKEIEVSYNEIIDGTLKQFILPGEITSQGQYCKGFLGIAKNCVYIQSRLSKAYGIILPNILHSVDNNAIKNNVIRALSWILLGFTDFNVGIHNEFFNLNPDFKFNISYRHFKNAVFMDPSNFAVSLF